ncbi:T9SS type A sorting domain-containing protein [Chryseobacterium sp. MYb264]|uniref:T9SS type A sorting domain-containing protein n=1 Tax=Chryseobacterium sp. MYb264 TaxID=2745153 RepID=UPI002E10732F|nr:T9SS type A sorting domain-containing protein [Chryseobacterium sp. MYb264]
MKKLYASALTIAAFLGVSAQEILWQKEITSSTQDFLSQITTTIDGQYLISGSIIQPDRQLKTENRASSGYDIRLMKLSPQGEKKWEKFFSGNGHDYVASTIATREGGFLVAATSFSGKGMDKKEDSGGTSQIWLIRLNEEGDELWQKSIGGSSNEEARAVVQTADLGFVVAGNITQASEGYGLRDILMVKLDKEGKEVSRSVLKGSGNHVVEKMIPTRDGGVLLGIYSRESGFQNEARKSESGDRRMAIHSLKTATHYGEGDFQLIKLSKEGHPEWQKTYGGTGDDHLRTLALTSYGYLICGESRSKISGSKTVDIQEGTDIWLVAVNERGEEVFQKSYSFGNRDVAMGLSVLNGSDNTTKKVIIGGYTQTEGRMETGEETFWLLCLNGEGNEEFRKYVKGESGSREERLSDIQLNKDGSILLAGTSAHNGLGSENWKVVKLGDKQIDQMIERQDIKIYPNPVADYAYVEIGYDFKEAEINVFDMSGRQLQGLKTKNKVTKINTQALIQGAYLVTIKTDENKTANAKLIKK